MLGEYESHRAFPSDGLFRFGSPCGRQCSVLQINSWRHMPVPWACRDHVEQQPVVWPSFRQRGYLHVNLQARGRRRNRNEPGISGSHTPICTVYRCGEAPRIEKKKMLPTGPKYCPHASIGVLHPVSGVKALLMLVPGQDVLLAHCRHCSNPSCRSTLNAQHGSNKIEETNQAREV